MIIARFSDYDLSACSVTKKDLREMQDYGLTSEEKQNLFGISILGIEERCSFMPTDFKWRVKVDYYLGSTMSGTSKLLVYPDQNFLRLERFYPNPDDVERFGFGALAYGRTFSTMLLLGLVNLNFQVLEDGQVSPSLRKFYNGLGLKDGQTVAYQLERVLDYLENKGYDFLRVSQLSPGRRINLIP